MVRILLRLVVVALLTWQVALVLARDAARVAAAVDADWSLRLFADTDTRLRRALGPDAEVLFALRDAVPPGTILLNKKIMGRPEDFTIEELQRLAAKNGLVDQLTTLSYPDPWLLHVPDPIPTAEQQVRAGRDMWLFATPGDPLPDGRPGWSRVTSTPHFEIWRFRTD